MIMKDNKNFDTVFILNQTEHAVTFPKCTGVSDSVVVYANDVREVKKETWKAIFKTYPQVGELIKNDEIRVLTMPNDAAEILPIVERLDKLGKANQMEIERMTPEEQAIVFQQKRRADYDAWGNPFVVASAKKVV
jgi:hypothetical protein